MGKYIRLAYSFVRYTGPYVLLGYGIGKLVTFTHLSTKPTTIHPDPARLPPHLLATQKIYNPDHHPLQYTTYVLPMADYKPLSRHPDIPDVFDMLEELHQCIPMYPQRILSFFSSHIYPGIKKIDSFNLPIPESNTKDDRAVSTIFREGKIKTFMGYSVDYFSDDCLMLSRKWCGGFAETCVLRRKFIAKDEDKGDNHSEEKKPNEDKIEFWMETVYWSPNNPNSVPLAGYFFGFFVPLAAFYSRMILGVVTSEIQFKLTGWH